MLRKFKPSDKKELLNIFQRNIPAYFDPEETMLLSRYLDTQGDTYWTMEHKNKIVGGIGHYFDTNDNSGQITWIFFDPDYSGQGLGKQAMEHCLAILEANPKLEKLVVRTSQLVYGFFEKFGFKLQYTEKNYWGPGLDLYYMEK
ncbi:MAG: GNAT family N-acetyltransferase [Flavobacteriaceae bacterium]